MRRGTNDALISFGALVLLLVGLVSIDDRVRDRVERVIFAARIDGPVGCERRRRGNVLRGGEVPSQRAGGPHRVDTVAAGPVSVSVAV